jgi:hypothetical protein
VRFAENSSGGRAIAMKIIPRAFLISWTPFALAQGINTSTPTELLEARAHYEAAIAAATKPIRERYLQELEQLKTTAYFTKNFDLANAVVQEIAAMGETEAGGSGTDGTGSPEDRVEERLINTTWLWWGGGTITFLADGRARCSNTRGTALTWKVAGATPPVIEGESWNGGKYRMTLDAGLRTGKLVEAPLQERSTSQIGFK